MRPTSLIAFGLILLLMGCDDAEERRFQQWEGAVVVKICRNGTHIYRLRNGEFRTGDDVFRVRTELRQPVVVETPAACE